MLRLATHLKFVNDPTNIINAIDNDSLVMDVYVKEWLQRLKVELIFAHLGPRWRYVACVTVYGPFYFYWTF